MNDITTFIFDVDGVLTNGDVIATDSGELMRTFNIKDGYAFQLAVKKGYHVCIISGGRGQAMEKRFEGLGIPDVFLGVSFKFGNLIEHPMNASFIPDGEDRGFFGRMWNKIFKGKDKNY